MDRGVRDVPRLAGVHAGDRLGDELRPVLSERGEVDTARPLLERCLELSPYLRLGEQSLREALAEGKQ